MPFTVNGTSSPARLPRVRVTSLMWASLVKPVSAAVAAAESSVAAAAFATVPFCQAVRNVVAAVRTSAADRGPLFTALPSAEPSSAAAPAPNTVYTAIAPPPRAATATPPSTRCRRDLPDFAVFRSSTRLLLPTLRPSAAPGCLSFLNENPHTRVPRITPWAGPLLTAGPVRLLAQFPAPLKVQAPLG